MLVLSSDDSQFGIVDHMEGSTTIKLKKDDSGQHHYIPLEWVKTVDSKVHCDRPMAQAKKEWAAAAPSMSMGAASMDAPSKN